jgi:hypothetical protein
LPPELVFEKTYSRTQNQAATTWAVGGSAASGFFAFGCTASPASTI